MQVWGTRRRPLTLRPDRRGAERAAAPVPLRPDAFLLHLVESRAIERTAAERARIALQLGGSLPVVLCELGLISEDRLVDLLAQWCELEPAGAERPPNALLLDRLPRDYCRRLRLLPLEDGPSPRVALADPFHDDLLPSLRYVLGPQARFVVIGPSAFDATFRALYGEDEPSDAAEADGGLAGTDTERLEDAARQAPIVRLANALLRTAFELGASDIHVEPGESDLVARFRVDGVLVRPTSHPRALHTGLVTRIKILAGLNIAERRLPQDGRLTTVDRGREVDVRVSVLPTANGEALVLRLLGQGQKPQEAASLETLGYTTALAASVERMASRPNGIFLVTGPTGSGKTTTLYTLLSRLNDGRTKIVAVEDPVEYRVPGIQQVQTHAAIGLDFAGALRSILRQDPDVVMIGEIRDGETARIAVQAALTGHLVVSTLHTNSAAAAITRLADMGVEPYLLAATLNGVLAQRLVRLLCTACRAVAPATSAETALLVRCGALAPGAAPPPLAHPVGCPDCNGTGFRGRMVIAEGIEFDEALRARVSERETEAAIRAIARRGGMTSLADHGINRVLALETSLKEVMRHLELDAGAAAAPPEAA